MRLNFLHFFLKNLSVRQTILRNGFWRFLASFINKGLRMLVVFFAARLLGPESFGLFSYTFSFIALCFIFSDWGINILSTRSLASGMNAGGVISASVLAKIFVLVFSAVLAILISVSTDYVDLALALVVILFFSLNAFRDLFINFLVAKQRSEFEVPVLVAEGVVLLMTMLFVLSKIPSPIGYAWMNTFSVLISFILAYFIAREVIPVTFERVSLKSVEQILKDGIPLAFFGIIGFIFFASDQLFIRYFLGLQAVGHYALASRIVFSAFFIPGIIVSVLFPELVKRIGDNQNIKYFFHKFFYVLIILGLIVSAVIFLSSYFLPRFIPAYTQSVNVMKLLSIILIMVFPSVWLDNVLIALKKQKQDFYLTFFSAMLNIVLNVFLIPKYGIIGAVYATLLSQFINLVVTYCYTIYCLNRLEKNYASTAV